MECFVVTSDKISVTRIMILTYWRYFIGTSGPDCLKMVIKVLEISLELLITTSFTFSCFTVSLFLRRDVSSLIFLIN